MEKKYIITLDGKNSPPYETKEQLLEMWDKTHRTSSIWEMWTEPQTQKTRYNQIGFKVVYSEDDIKRMHPNQLKSKFEEYQQYLTPATLDRMRWIAKTKGINL